MTFVSIVQQNNLNARNIVRTKQVLKINIMQYKAIKSQSVLGSIAQSYLASPHRNSWKFLIRKIRHEYS